MPKATEVVETPAAVAEPSAPEVQAEEPQHDEFRAPVEPPVDGAALNRANVERHNAALEYLQRCAEILQSAEPDKPAALAVVTDALPAAVGHEGLAAARSTVAFCLHLLSIGEGAGACLARLAVEAAAIRRTLSHLGEGANAR